MDCFVREGLYSSIPATDPFMERRMTSREVKIERSFSNTETAQFLRDLAAAIEDGDQMGLLEEYGVSLHNSKKIKLGIKRAGEEIILKLKIKSAAEAYTPEAGAEGSERPAAEERPGYKSLKKRMKSTFKRIGNALEQGQLPASPDIEQFLADSRLMVSYAGKGDEFYAAYTAACQGFNTAVQGGDPAAVLARYRALDQLKSDCHQRYK